MSQPPTGVPSRSPLATTNSMLSIALPDQRSTSSRVRLQSARALDLWTRCAAFSMMRTAPMMMMTASVVVGPRIAADLRLGAAQEAAIGIVT
jgi:hypothetical protein